MLKKTYKILDIFAKTPWKKFTFKDIKSLSKSKSESYISNTLKDFIKQDILLKEEIGNVSLYRLNYHPKAVAYLAAAYEYDSWQKKHIPYECINEIISRVPAVFFTFIITGSYAQEKQTKKSDIDIVIISDTEPKKIYAELKHSCEMNIPPIHLYVFTEKEFLQMLLDKKPNYGKEITKNNLIFLGAEAYYRIIFEAIKNGYAG